MADKSSNHSPKLACIGPTTPKLVEPKLLRSVDPTDARCANRKGVVWIRPPARCRLQFGGIAGSLRAVFIKRLERHQVVLKLLLEQRTAAPPLPPRLPPGAATCRAAWSGGRTATTRGF